MNKRALKEFAVYARNELRNQIALRAQAFGITPEGSPVLVTGVDYIEINEKKLPLSYKNGLQKLLEDIKNKGYDQVIEEVAYTWFNRLIAIRYMEVHNYLPSKIRVLSSEIKGKVDPDILTEYQYTELPVNNDEIASLLQQGKREEAYRKLLIAQCNELHEIMPFLFEKVADYTELLLPESLLHADSLINKLGKELEGENFEHVEVIGWLYQYYISEKKDEVFAGLKKNKKITKENIPAATQLFTPHWIVRYMVENSLGHMWLESHPESNLKAEMKYYVEPAEQEPEVQAKLEELRNPNLSPEDITILDPACGSGHILVYAFDLLYKIYEERGYPAREIPFLILEKNLYGIDIDDRAAQLAAFALMMKSREKTKKIFRNPPKLNVISIQESNDILIDQAAELIGENETEVDELKTLLETFIDAKNYGSILQPEKVDFDKYLRKIEQLKQSGEHTLETFEVYEQLDKIEKIIKQAKMLASQYDVVVTNPPYMGSGKMNHKLSKYLTKNFIISKRDLYTVFIDKCLSFVHDNGLVSMITQQSWMFASAYEEFRKKILLNSVVYSLLHLGPGTFEDISGERVNSASFTLRKNQINSYIPIFIDLTSYDTPTKEKGFFDDKNKYDKISQNVFLTIPKKTICYWTNPYTLSLFSNSNKISFKAGRALQTGNDDMFVRLWYEVPFLSISFSRYSDDLKWYPFNKGGPFRRWYGNNEYVLNWEEDGKEIKKLHERGVISATLRNLDFFFKEGITYTYITSGMFSARYSSETSTYSGAGPGVFCEKMYYLLGFLNSKVFMYLIRLLKGETERYETGDVESVPLLSFRQTDEKNIESLVKNLINISRIEWDSFEVSWDFKQHPLLTHKKESKTIEQAFSNWASFAEQQFYKLKANEEELNRIFIELYGLQDELTPEVPDEEVTIRCADRMRDAKSFLSYCIGLMMGRYSLDVEGLAYAGGEWDASKYKTFQPDKDGIIPLTETAYFEDDVITRLQELLILMFGEDTLAENLRWLAESLTMKNNETPTERLRRYFFDEFYADHCKVYQKRPIYWMAESGSKKGFRALFYLHRYTPETLATMRFTYVQNLQEKLRQEQKRLEQDLINPDLSAAMKKRYEKQLNQIKAQQEELVEYDKKLAELANQRIALDLDDGVVVNYEQLKTILAKIK